MLRLFRVDEADELRGLDIIKHNEPAYPKGGVADCVVCCVLHTLLCRRGDPGGQAHAVPHHHGLLQGRDGQPLRQEKLTTRQPAAALRNQHFPSSEMIILILVIG